MKEEDAKGLEGLQYLFTSPRFTHNIFNHVINVNLTLFSIINRLELHFFEFLIKYYAYPLIDIQVGRIIGKGGQNVREMQRLTGAVIKLPEQVWCKEKKRLKEIHR